MITNWPERYLGQPWKTGGREAKDGFDCWGFLRWVYKCEFNIEVSEHVAPVGELAPPAEVVAEELTSQQWLPISGPTIGDVVALGRGKPGYMGTNSFSHVGIYVETPAPALLHIIANGTSCIVTLKALYRQGFGNVKFYRHVKRNLY